MVHRTFSLAAICLAAVLYTLTITISCGADDQPHGGVIRTGIDFSVHHVPKGQAVVFMAMNYKSINIFLCRPDRTITRLQTERRIAKYPSPSNDGRRVYFESAEDIPYTGTRMTKEERELVDNNPLFQFQIYTVDMLTGGYARISDGNTLDSFPVSSPDGSQVAFCSRLPRGDSRWKITLMDHDGSDRYQLNPADDDSQLWPAWSPDAKRIVYMSSRLAFGDDGKPRGQKTALMIHDLEARSTRKLPTGDAILNEPSWSPSGDWISFTKFDIKAASYSLWKINADGSGMQRLTDGPEDRHASWLSDGQALLFTRAVKKGGGKKEICMVDAKTGQITRLISASDASLEYPHAYPAGGPKKSV